MKQKLVINDQDVKTFDTKMWLELCKQYIGVLYTSEEYKTLMTLSERIWKAKDRDKEVIFKTPFGEIIFK